jgi:hypothetical protein
VLGEFDGANTENRCRNLLCLRHFFCGTVEVGPYILTLQLVSLSILATAHPAIFSTQFWLLWILTLPAVLLGSLTGIALYRRMSEVNFRQCAPPHFIKISVFAGALHACEGPVRGEAV